MKTDNTVQDVRNGIKRLPNMEDGRKAVIVATPYSKRKQTLGVQFWTKENIQAGSVQNADNTVSTLVELF